MARLRHSTRLDMRNSTTARLVTRATLLLIAASVTGCLPIRVTYRDSPPLQGIYRAPNGTPVANARVLLSTSYSDAGCASPAVETRTDSSGRFALPERKHVERFIILLPIDRVASYRLCLAAGDTVRAAYRSASLGMAPASGGRLECFQWRATSGEMRVNCGNRSEAMFARGGQWTSADGATGHYRLLTFLDPDDGSRLAVLVQWVPGPLERNAPDARATVDLNETTGMFGLFDPDLESVGDHWQVRARGTKRQGKPYAHDVVVELGGPGEARVVADSCRTDLLHDLWAAQRRCP